MIVVADTSPLNYLVRLQRIDLLELLYGRVIVPDAVVKELRHARAPDVVRNWALALPGWIEFGLFRASVKLSHRNSARANAKPSVLHSSYAPEPF